MKSFDFKQLAVTQYFKEKSYRKAAKIMNVAHSSIYRWVNSGIKPKKRKYVSNLLQKSTKYIETMLADNPFLTWHELAWHLQKKGLKMSTKTVGRIIKKLGYTYKRAVHTTPCRWSEDKIKDFEYTLSKVLNTNHVISIDECNFSEKLLPFRGYSKRGTKLITTLSKPSWSAISLLMAVSNKGEHWYQLIHGSVTGVSFQKFMQTLPENSTIILDNASIHRTFHDNRKLFIPPYSPKYNPIEMIFSKVKRKFRQLMQSYDSTTNQNIVKAIETLRPSDITNSFDHVHRNI